MWPFFGANLHFELVGFSLVGVSLCVFFYRGQVGVSFGGGTSRALSSHST